MLNIWSYFKFANGIMEKYSDSLLIAEVEKKSKTRNNFIPKKATKLNFGHYQILGRIWSKHSFY